MTEQELFAAALEIADPTERAAYLQHTCGANDALRKRVSDLLEAHERSGEFLDAPAMEKVNRVPPKVSGKDDAADVLALLESSTSAGCIGRLGHYEVQGVLGKGGFGVVLKGFDDKLQRPVAIKVLDPRMAATSPPRKRFLREARSAAKIRHQNVVGVYAVDEHPIPYLVMEFIPGETLQQALDKRGPFSVLDVIRIGRQIALGLAAAHELGLIHRDIKPSNIIVEAGPDPQVKITDFGLARAVDDASLTQSGAIAGTPLYMSPEQALGQTIDQRADLFSLGSVLYVLCTGRPPFRAPTTMAVLKRVVEDQPRPIREIIPDVPDWLCEIIARLHAKDPSQRFPTAREVSEALAKHQMEAEGILPVIELSAVRPDAPTLPSIELSKAKAAPAVPGRRSRNRGALIGVACTALFALMLGLTDAAGITDIKGSVIRLMTPSGTLVIEVDDPAIGFAIDGDAVVITGAGAKEIRVNAGPHQIRTVKDGVVLRQELVTVSRNGRQVVRISQQAPSAVVTAPSTEALKIIESPVTSTEAVKSIKPAAEWLSLRRENIPASALALAGNGDPARAPQSLVGVLGEAHPRPSSGCSSVAYSPDGKWLAASSWDHHVYIRDTASGRIVRVLTAAAPLNYVVFGPDSKSLLSLSQDGHLCLWDLDAGEQPTAIPTQLTEAVLAQSMDRQMIAVGNRDQIKLWTWGKWDSPEGFQPPELKSKLNALAISPNHQWIAYGSAEPDDTRAAQVRIANAATGELVTTLPMDSNGLFALAFSKNGQRLAAVGNNVNGRIWETSTWSHQSQIEWATYPGEWHHGYSIAWGPDDESIVVGSHWRATLHDSTGKLIRSLWFVEFDNVQSVCLSPDGQTIAASHNRGDVMAWDLQSGEQRYLDLGHQRRVQAFVVCRDGKHVLSLGSEMAVMTWDVSQPTRPIVTPLRLDSSLQPQFFSLFQGQSDHDFVVPSRLMIVAGNSTTQQQAVIRMPLYFADHAGTPDGKIMVASGHDGHLHLWDVAQGLDVHKIPAVGSSEGRLAVSPDSQLVGFCQENPQTYTVWNLTTGNKHWSTELGNRGSTSAFSPDGQTVAVGHHDGSISVFSMQSHELIRSLTGHNGRVQSLKFGPDNRTLVSGGHDGMIRVWSTDRQRALQVIPLGPANQPLLIDLDPSGEFLFAAGEFPCIYVLKLSRDEG